MMIINIFLKKVLQCEVDVLLFTIFMMENGQKGARTSNDGVGKRDHTKYFKGCLMLIALFIVLLAHCKLFGHKLNC